MRVKLVVQQRLLVRPLALSELEVEGDDRQGGWDELEDDGWHHVGKGENAEDKEVERQEEVDVLLAEDLKPNKSSTLSATADDIG